MSLKYTSVKVILLSVNRNLYRESSFMNSSKFSLPYQEIVNYVCAVFNIVFEVAVSWMQMRIYKA